jgi:chaperone BCS1
MTAFRELSKKSLLLIEDIDCLFEQRKTTIENPNITFSSLINIMDGVLYKHGIIIFITTNHPEKLDAALMRMGRIDMIVQMNYPREQDIQKLFYDMNEKHGTLEEIAKSYTKFYDKIKGKNMSMSAIVNFLFHHRMKWAENVNDLLEPIEFLNRLSGDDKKNILYS